MAHSTLMKVLSQNLFFWRCRKMSQIRGRSERTTGAYFKKYVRTVSERERSRWAFCDNAMKHLQLLCKWWIIFGFTLLSGISLIYGQSNDSCQTNSDFQVGLGISDITGPAAEVGMMGYAMIDQTTAGIHTRLWSRAFVIQSPCNGKRVVFVSADLGEMFQAVKQAIIKRIQGDSVLKQYYSNDNVLLSANHTHTGPGGHSHYTLYNLTILGYNRQNFEAVVDGIYESIQMAHHNLSSEGGKILFATGKLLGKLGREEIQALDQRLTNSFQQIPKGRFNLIFPDSDLSYFSELNASFNRSLRAFLLNPEAQGLPPDISTSDERVTDKEMTLLRFNSKAGTPVGMINWFAIHTTSMSNKNQLISADNKGYASDLFENLMQPQHNSFVAAFAQSNEGDVSPNQIDGGTAHRLDPLGFKDTEISAKKQMAKALELFLKADQPLMGAIDYRHSFVDMDNVTIDPSYTGGISGEKTCPAAIGVSMIAGAEDGTGFGREGWSCDNTNWSCGPKNDVGCVLVRTIFQNSCNTQTNPCQGNKPIAVETGKKQPALPCQNVLAPWTPQRLPIQILKIGNLVILGAPFEMTTMAGRRLRDQIQKQLEPIGVNQVVIAGLSNSYAGYLATREEYQSQNYEGASTHFGPWTLAATIQEFDRLAIDLKNGTPSKPGEEPMDLSQCQWTLQPSVIFDDAPGGDHGFGKLDQDVPEEAQFKTGDQVDVKFWGAHPKNNLKRNSTYLKIEKMNDQNGAWELMADDNDWETKLIWERVGVARSKITVKWNIPESAPSGTYRICHQGAYRRLFIGRRNYAGCSRTFKVVNPHESVIFRISLPVNP